MNICETSIRRPVMTTLVMSAILLFGAMAFRLLPVSDLPNVDRAMISVSASLPGANPDTMASSVALPLEKRFSTISGVEAITSSSQTGSCNVTLQFALNRDLDAAAQDVQTAISQTQRSLPRDMPAPPSYSKVNPADQPILFIALTSPLLPLSDLDEYGQTMTQQISQISGVAQVSVYGGQKYAVRVRLDPRELASRGIGINEVEAAIDAANVNLPSGVLYGPHKAFTLNSQGQLLKAEQYRSLVVVTRNSSPVRLEELGQVADSVENDRTAAWFCQPNAQQRSIIMAVQRQPGTNTVEVAQAVRKLLPTFEQQLPPSVSLHVLYDRSESIKNSVDDVKFTLWLTLVLVVLVIFLFLRSVRATLIPSLTLPLSVVGTFAVMHLLHYSLDNLSLMALTLSVGFIVDDAIVMLENIVRHQEMGKGRLQAALDGSKEIGFTIVSMTLSLAAVFIPVLFMGGIVGRLFREFAVTIGVAVLVSGVISLTLTPMLSSRFLRAGHAVRHGHVYAVSERFFQGMIRLYGLTLRPVLRHRLATLLISLGILAATVYLFMHIPLGFIPSEDQGRINITTETLEGTSYKSMFEHQQAVAAVLQQVADVEEFMSSAGGRTTQNTGNMLVKLKPRAPRGPRTRTADDLVNILREKLSQVPGVKVYVQNPPVISIGGRSSKSQYQFTLQGPDPEELYDNAQWLFREMRNLSGLEDVASDLQIKNPQVNLKINRDLASTLELTPLQIESALYSAYGSRQVSTIFAPNNQYSVIVELQDRYQNDPESLALLYLRSPRGGMVPLKAVADVDIGVGPMSINHTGQLPSVTISFNLKAGMPLGEAMKQVTAMAAGKLPGSIATSFSGTAQEFQTAQKGMGLLLLLAVLVIYIVLGILYESFIHPVTILSALPFAGFGALATLMLFNTELSLYAFVGIIMLVGLVKKNGIMMIDFALAAQKGGKNAVDAIYEACLVRFRPIMMTTMAALMAGLPIALGYGAGAESRRPLGLAIVGGLLFSQTLTMYVTPVIFLYMESLRRLLGGAKQPATVDLANESHAVQPAK